MAIVIGTKICGRRADKMRAWQCYYHAVILIAISTWTFQEAIFEVLQWWYGNLHQIAYFGGS